MLKQLARSRLFICSGEPSGDLYARLLIEKLKKFTSKPTIYCVGGRELHLDGVKLVQDTIFCHPRYGPGRDSENILSRNGLIK